MAQNHSTQQDFDPRAHLTDVKGGKYLPVTARILWFRHDHPGGILEADAHLINDQIAIFRARAVTPDGGVGVGYGSCTPAQFRDGYVEKAETKAKGRALLALGYGTPDDELDDQDGLSSMSDAPMNMPQQSQNQWGNQSHNNTQQPPQNRSQPQQTYQNSGNASGSNANNPNAMTPAQYGKIIGISKDRGVPEDQFPQWFHDQSGLAWPNVTKREASGIIDALMGTQSSAPQQQSQNQQAPSWGNSGPSYDDMQDVPF